MSKTNTSRVIITKRLITGDSFYSDDEYLVDLSIKIPYRDCFGKRRYCYRRVYTASEHELYRLGIYSKSQILNVLLERYLKQRREERMLRVIKNLPN